MKASRLFLTSCLMIFHSPLNGSENSGGEIVRGLPCVKRLNQLFCGSRGKSYPSTAIDKFIDDNKALLKRMYGELQEPRTVTTIRVVRTFKDSSSTRSSDSGEMYLKEHWRRWLRAMTNWQEIQAILQTLKELEDRQTFLEYHLATRRVASKRYQERMFVSPRWK